MQKRVPVTLESTHCSTCMMGHVCVPVGMPSHEVAQLDDLVKERIRIEKGQVLYQHGDTLDALFGLRTGSLKTQITEASGQHQITGFYLPGEIIGLDGMMEGAHTSSAVAMEDSEVCVVRLDTIDEISRFVPSLQQQIRRLMSKEIVRSHQVLLALGSMRSEQRLAAFLINLSQRLSALGYSSSEFIMRMSREEIGNYLGLTLETVSRLFSRFAREGMIRVNQREIKIIDIAALNELVGKPC
ncbi:fumarate/nitrate reduction transcriptional regulator Fnr [Zwartia sp.]|uniref:fumarate/nitrate reduction transcriptional regulator Fnr n=1 Tax=Zwartia sp. TaxID=2978004 RepID=UPI002717D0A3|nr:fumarate/nitrate reduction transcriptional regulator Fnr [Zwartia sp.]MDO9024866.1 fumarate/nitrate reduction transcriptional regulator Fnr [Zwartia sp.]